MSFGNNFISVLIFVIISTAVVDSLWCYQCATTGRDSATRGCLDDYEGLLNATLIKNDSRYYTYIKDCTASNPRWDRCVIEEIYGSDYMTLYHRGCHDGKSFSSDVDSFRFYNLAPNNYSTCQRFHQTGKQVCFRFCAEDFCNGPQPPEDKCLWHRLHPDTYQLPAGLNCTAVGIHADSRPIGLRVLCLMIVPVFLIGSLF